MKEIVFLPMRVTCCRTTGGMEREFLIEKGNSAAPSGSLLITQGQPIMTNLLTLGCTETPIIINIFQQLRDNPVNCSMIINKLDLQMTEAHLRS